MIPKDRYVEVFDKAGMMFFNRGNLISKYLLKISDCRYSHLGVYFKTSENQYECWFTDIGAIEGAVIHQCNMEKLLNEMNISDFGVKPLRMGIPSEYEVKLRLTIAKLAINGNISVDDTVRELYDHPEKTSRTPLQTFLVLNHELNKPTTGKYHTDFFNVINQTLDVGFANIDCRSSMERLLNDNQHYIAVTNYEAGSCEMETTDEMIDQLLKHGQILTKLMIDDVDLSDTVMKTQISTSGKLTREQVAERCHGQVNYWLTLGTLLCSADHSGKFDLVIYDQIRSDIGLSDTSDKISGDRELKLSPKNINLVHFENKLASQLIPDISLNGRMIDERTGERHINEFRNLSRSMAECLYSGNGRGILNIAVIKKHFIEARKFISGYTPFVLRVPALNASKIVFTDYSERQDKGHPVSFTSKPDVSFQLPLYEMMMIECFRIKMLTMATSIPFMQLEHLQLAINNIGHLCRLQQEDLQLEATTISIVTSHFAKTDTLLTVKNFRVKSSLVERDLAEIGDLLSGLVSEIKNKKMFDVSRCNAISRKVMKGWMLLRHDDITIDLPDIVIDDISRQNIHLDNSKNFAVDEKWLVEVHGSISETIKKIEDNTVPVIDLGTMVRTINQLNDALHSKLPNLTAPRTAPIAAMIYHGDFKPADVSSMMDSGEIITISTINPQLDGLTKDQLEELLIKIDTVQSEADDFTVLQTKIAEALALERRNSQRRLRIKRIQDEDRDFSEKL